MSKKVSRKAAGNGAGESEDRADYGSHLAGSGEDVPKLDAHESWIRGRIEQLNVELVRTGCPVDFDGARELLHGTGRTLEGAEVTQIALQLATGRNDEAFPTDDDFVKATALSIRGVVFAALMESTGDVSCSLWRAMHETERRINDRWHGEILWAKNRENPDLVKLLPWNKAKGTKTPPTDSRLIAVLAPATDKRDDDQPDIPSRYLKCWESPSRMGGSHWPSELKPMKTGGGLTLNEAYFLVRWWSCKSHPDPRRRIDLSKYRLKDLQEGRRVMQRLLGDRWEDVSFLPVDCPV